MESSGWKRERKLDGGSKDKEGVRERKRQRARDKIESTVRGSERSKWFPDWVHSRVELGREEV